MPDTIPLRWCAIVKQQVLLTLRVQLSLALHLFQKYPNRMPTSLGGGLSFHFLYIQGLLLTRTAASSSTFAAFLFLIPSFGTCTCLDPSTAILFPFPLNREYPVLWLFATSVLSFSCGWSALTCHSQGVSRLTSLSRSRPFSTRAQGQPYSRLYMPYPTFCLPPERSQSSHLNCVVST